ncbi:MAG: prepilin-type N-terminal cleavage/methylation domain-containing protein [Candidatus Omnitrophota bacterium]
MKSRAGFTLVEIMLALVVIGILAGMAYSRVIAIAERSRGAEAREIIYKAYAGYQRARDDGEAIVGIDNNKWSQFGLSNPNSRPDRYFNYTFSPAGSTNPSTCRATRGGRYIEINLATGVITNTSAY